MDQANALLKAGGGKAAGLLAADRAKIHAALQAALEKLATVKKSQDELAKALGGELTTQPPEARESGVPGIAAPVSTPRTAAYRVLTRELAGTELQANHLNQNAAFRGVIPEDEGLCVGMRGNALTEVGSPHYNFHRSLEQFWDQYRRGGPLFNTRPTNAQYGQALQRALEAGGFTPAQAADLAAQAARQRAAYDLAETGLVPRIPGQLNQKPPPPR